MDKSTFLDSLNKRIDKLESIIFKTSNINIKSNANKLLKVLTKTWDEYANISNSKLESINLKKELIDIDIKIKELKKIK